MGSLLLSKSRQVRSWLVAGSLPTQVAWDRCVFGPCELQIWGSLIVAPRQLIKVEGRDAEVGRSPTWHTTQAVDIHGELGNGSPDGRFDIGTSRTLPWRLE